MNGKFLFLFAVLSILFVLSVKRKKANIAYFPFSKFEIESIAIQNWACLMREVRLLH
jgi:hypothetical protein